MVEVVVQQQSGSSIGQSMGMVQQIFQTLFDLAPWIIGMVVIMTLGIIIYMIFFAKEEQAKERDEPAYYMYKQTIRSCLLNCRNDFIRKHYRLVNLLWLGIPILKKEHSVKVVDMSNNLIGWYRGESKEMDNTYNLLLYKDKSFIFFENKFILKIPISLEFNTVETDDEGNAKKDSVGRIIHKKRRVNMMNLIKRLPNMDLKIYCASIQKVAQYYYCPVFIIDNERGMLDYRKVLEGAIVDNTYQTMVTRLLNTGSKQMEKGMMFNPYLQYAQKAPQKTKEEEKGDEVE